MQATLQKTTVVECNECDEWTRGHVHHVRVLDEYYEGGTDEDNVGWDEVYNLPCGCSIYNDDDMFTVHEQVWVCGVCESMYSAHADGMVAAANCCKSRVLQRIKQNTTGRTKINGVVYRLSKDGKVILDDTVNA